MDETYQELDAAGRLRRWLVLFGFTPFEAEGQTNFENKPVNVGGIRLEVCSDVASIYCLAPKVALAAVPLEDVRTEVLKILNQQKESK